MTIAGYLKSRLVNSGLFEDMADRVIEAVKADPVNESMEDRWDDEAEGYPEGIHALMALSACQHTLKIIDAECPKHWARPIFAMGRLPG